jgi:hypothetical protein
VTDIFLVSDNGPAPSASQTVLIDNTDVNGTLYDYEFTNKNDCKDGGWKNFTFPPGPFKNQGQSRALVRHGADPGEALAAVLGVAVEDIQVRDRPD